METTARGDVPKTLQTIAYISIPNSADLEFLLWDLQDAITAYAQLSGTALPHLVDLKAMTPAALPMASCWPLKMWLTIRRWQPSSRRLSALAVRGRASTPRFEPHNRAPSRRGTAVRLHKACERHNQLWWRRCRLCRQRYCGASPFPHAWASCADHFRRRWISLWALCAWAAPLSMRSCLAVAMPVASMPAAWCVSSPRCPRRSGAPSAGSLERPCSIK